MKLKSCPFCGVIPNMPEGPFASTYLGPRFIGFNASIECINRCCFVIGKKDRRTEEGAIKEAARRWNTRVIDNKEK